MKRDWPMCIAVVGPTGDLVYFVKMDTCQYASVGLICEKPQRASVSNASGSIHE